MCYLYNKKCPIKKETAVRFESVIQTGKGIKTLKKQNTLWSTEVRNLLLKEKMRTYKRLPKSYKKQDWKDFNTKQNSTKSKYMSRKNTRKKEKRYTRSTRKTKRYIYKPRVRQLNLLCNHNSPSCQYKPHSQ